MFKFRSRNKAPPMAVATEIAPGGPESGAEVHEEFEYKKVKYMDFITKPKYIPWWLLGIIVLVLVALIALNHDVVIEKLTPASEKIRELPAGFLIPVVILIAISFPPLFGHEIIALLCGVVYGLWIGFAIVAAGTFLGEIGTWYAFKYAFRRKAVKLERTNLNYGALARLTRDGGFLVVLIIRFSVIPSHFSTAVFSTCNVKFWHFAVATFLTLPKQIILVYVGVLLVQKSKSNTVNDIVLALTFVITLIAGLYVYNKMRKTKKVLLAEQSARQDAKRAVSATSEPSIEAGQVERRRTEQEEGIAPTILGGSTSSTGPVTAEGEWQGAYEMSDTSRPARTHEMV